MHFVRNKLQGLWGILNQTGNTCLGSYISIYKTYDSIEILLWVLMQFTAYTGYRRSMKNCAACFLKQSLYTPWRRLGGEEV
jgi:hypothetical protein